MSIRYRVGSSGNEKASSSAINHKSRLHLVSPVNKKSRVWIYFSVYANDKGEVADKSVAICTLCNKECKVSGGTTNMFKHLRRHHLQEFDSIMSRPQTEQYVPAITQAETTSSTQSTKRKRREWENDTSSRNRLYVPLQYINHRSNNMNTSRETLASFIARELLPIDIVSRSALRDLIATIDVQKVFDIPSVDDVRGTIIPSIYEKIRAQLRLELQESPGISLVVNLENGLLIISAVYAIPESFSQIWRQIAFKRVDRGRDSTVDSIGVDGSETLAYAEQVLTSVLSQWLHPTAITAVISDAEEIARGNIRKLMNWTHIPSIQSIFQEMTEKSIESLVVLVRKCIRTLSYLASSTDEQRDDADEYREDIHEIAAEAKLLRPASGNKRMNYRSVLKLLRSVARSKEALESISLLSSAEKLFEEISLEDVREVEGISSILSLVESAELFIDQLGLCAFLPTMIELANQLYHVSNARSGQSSESTMIEKFKETIFSWICKHFGLVADSGSRGQMLLHSLDDDMIRMAAVASFLHPQFKGLEFLDDFGRKQLHELLVNEMELVSKSVAHVPNDNSHSQISGRARVHQLWNDIFGRGTEQERRSTESDSKTVIESNPPRESREISELEAYLFLSTTSEVGNPLSFWKNHISLFPILSVLALKYLPIPTNVGDSDILNVFRGLLSSETESDELDEMMYFIRLNHFEHD